VITTDLIPVAAEFGIGYQWQDEAAARTALGEFLETSGLPDHGVFASGNCVYAVWRLTFAIASTDAVELRQKLISLAELGAAEIDDERFPPGCVDSIVKVEPHVLHQMLTTALQRKHKDAARYAHLVEPLAYAAIEVLSIEEVGRLTNHTDTEIQTALAHKPTARAIDREAVAMVLDGRAARASAAVAQREIVERLRQIARDPAAAPSAVIAAGNALRDLSKGSIGMTVASSGPSNVLPGYTIETGVRRA